MTLIVSDSITISLLLNVATTVTGILDKEAALGVDSLVTPENIANLNFTLSEALTSLDEVINPVATINSSATTMGAFQYNFGAGPSNVFSFIVGGTDLLDDIVVAAPADYEVSLASGSGYASSLTFTPVDYTVTSTIVYVRLKAGLSASIYNEDITISSTGIADVTVALIGEVI